MTILNTQWDGQESEHSFAYRLQADESCLRFTVEFPSRVSGHPEARAGEFTPELWLYDVAEVFITGSSGKYLEINLSPNSAWWIQGFRAPREPDPEYEIEMVKAQIIGDSVVLEISRSELERYLGTTGWRANVTGILNSPDYVFLSASPLPGEQADFHQPAEFPRFS